MAVNRAWLAGLAFLAAASVQAQPAAELLECTASDVVTLSDHGTLVDQGGVVAYASNAYSHIIVDLSTGAVRFDGQPPTTWTVLRRGDADRGFDTVLVAVPNRPQDFFIRVRTWQPLGEGNIAPNRFFLIETATVVTGTCEIIGS